MVERELMEERGRDNECARCGVNRIRTFMRIDELPGTKIRHTVTTEGGCMQPMQGDPDRLEFVCITCMTEKLAQLPPS